MNVHRTMDLAGVAHNNPDHPGSWTTVLWAVVGLVGCGVLGTGVTLLVATARASGGSGGVQRGRLAALGTAFLAAGLAVAVLGFALVVRTH
ncbi:hypothetical protein [Peterkaempfera sp. SMS 1(5)a]|uniref:hypothetical protein n=1 Tax=Peterkaempfera podocarpi TaxID=3232308 RepID=UPI00366BCE59